MEQYGKHFLKAKADHIQLTDTGNSTIFESFISTQKLLQLETIKFSVKLLILKQFFLAEVDLYPTVKQIPINCTAILDTIWYFLI